MCMIACKSQFKVVFVCKECNWESLAKSKQRFEKLCDCGGVNWVRVPREFEEKHLNFKSPGLLVYRCLRCDQLHDAFS